MKTTAKPATVSLPIVVAVFVGLAASRYWPSASQQSPDPSSEAIMPLPIDDEGARTLYLIPGGAYTQSDIVANGGMTAAERYRGFRAVHDVNPEPGDAICPITQTKANPRCTWIVNGSQYQFCCPPCIDEFLTLAKKQPKRIKKPEAYTY